MSGRRGVWVLGPEISREKGDCLCKAIGGTTAVAVMSVTVGVTKAGGAALVPLPR